MCGNKERTPCCPPLASNDRLDREPRLQIFGNFLELPYGIFRVTETFMHRMLQAMVDMVVHQCFFCIGDCLFDRLQLLRNVQAIAVFLQHLDDAFQVALGAFQALENVGMRGVRYHFRMISPGRGLCKMARLAADK